MERDWSLVMIENEAEEILEEIIDLLNASVPDLHMADQNNVVDLIEELISLYNDTQDIITNIRDLT
jgi:hypothetical protein